MWKKLPVLLRAPLTGLLVTAIPSTLWGALVTANFRSHSQVPWSTIVIACFLWSYWKYLNGWGWPQSKALERHRALRSCSLLALTWRWTLLAGGLGQGASIALFLIAHRLVRWPHAAGPDLSTYSAATILPTLVMSGIVAGVSEEAGFRGYMQEPLERRYGPTIAIALTSIVFGLVHLSHGVFVPAILFDVGWGVLYGLLTYVSGSILPAVILHSTTDCLYLVLGWMFPDRASLPLVWQSGLDATFLYYCGSAILLGAGCAWAFRRLRGLPSSSFPAAR
jgi:membrane protease YdiL (CAAX protease family)